MFLVSRRSSVLPVCCRSTFLKRNLHLEHQTACLSQSVTPGNDAKSTEQTPARKTTFREEFRKFRSGSTFKYWVIGGSVFLSWMCYYGYKTYKNTRIEVLLPPPCPSHAIVRREQELAKLMQEYKLKSSYFGEPLTNLMVAGAPGSGKTVLAKEFCDMLLEKQNSYIPRSKVSVFLQADSLDSFLMSLKTFAGKLKIKPSELDEKVPGNYGSFSNAPFEEKCDVLFELIQEKLKKHSGWIIVIDNLQSTTPPVINEILIKWFLKDEHCTKWSRGTAISVYDLPAEKVQQWSTANVFTLGKGMEVGDCRKLLQQLINLDDQATEAPEIEFLATKLYCNPLALVCAAMLLKGKLQSSEIVSIKQAVSDLCNQIDTKVHLVTASNEHLQDFIDTGAGKKLILIETVIAMAADFVLSKNEYLLHGFDMLASCKPGSLLPQTLLNRHLLRHPFYKLPPIQDEGGGLLSVFSKSADTADNAEQSKEQDSELDPKGKAWSNKNLANYIRKVEDFFGEIVSAVKLTYNLIYDVLPELPEKDDGLDMFRSCELLQTAKIQPGGAKGVTMHPLVYNACRQHFTSATVFKLEADHLYAAQYNYALQPWYKKLTAFSEQATLQKYRSGDGSPVIKSTNGHIGRASLLSEAQAHLFRYNFGVNTSDVFTGSPFAGKSEDFWLPSAEDVVLHLQNHLSRVVDSISEEIRVSKQNVAGRAAKRNLLLHLEYILNNQPPELIGREAHIKGLEAMASCYISLNKDIESARKVLEHVHQLQLSAPSTPPLDIAHTLFRLAEIHNSLEEYEQARSLLEQSIEIYEADRKKRGEYSRVMEFGKAVALLGVVYGSLDEKQLSKDTLERALMLQQGGAPDLSDEAKSKQFGAEFASSLTDLGHSYVSLGLPLYGKKILDLALAAHKNLHGDDHPEVVRTLTVLGVAHLMQGHNEESRKLRREAAQVQKKLSAMPMF